MPSLSFHVMGQEGRQRWCSRKTWWLSDWLSTNTVLHLATSWQCFNSVIFCMLGSNCQARHAVSHVKVNDQKVHLDLERDLWLLLSLAVFHLTCQRTPPLHADISEDLHWHRSWKRGWFVYTKITKRYRFRSYASTMGCVNISPSFGNMVLFPCSWSYIFHTYLISQNKYTTWFNDLEFSRLGKYLD